MVQPFEVELLSDVEGVSEVWGSVGDGGEGGSSTSANDKLWMRNIWSVQNRAVVMSYFCVGFAIRFLTTPIGYYIVHYLGDSHAQSGVAFVGSVPPRVDDDGWTCITAYVRT